MATSHSIPRRAPARRKQERLPVWMTLTMAGLFVVLVYGLMAPKTPSAFDRPEAQVSPQGAPWNAPHAY